MGTEAETNKPTPAVGAAAVARGKVGDGVETSSAPVESKATAEPVEGGGKGPSALNGVFTDDDIATTLAAASEKLQAAHRKDQKKRKSALSRCLGALSPKRLFTRLRDYYINSCVMAADKGDFADLVAGHPGGMYYGDTSMSRNMSQRRDRERDEILQASLSRQVSISLSRQQSQQSPSGPLKMNRNPSTGISGLSRNASTGISGLNRNASTGISGMNRNGSTGFSGLNRNASAGISGLSRNPSTGIPGLTRNASTGISGLSRQASATGRSTFGKSPSSRKKADSNLFSAGRDTFMQKQSSASLLNMPVSEISKSGRQEPPPQ